MSISIIIYNNFFEGRGESQGVPLSNIVPDIDRHAGNFHGNFRGKSEKVLVKIHRLSCMNAPLHACILNELHAHKINVIIIYKNVTTLDVT